MFISAPDFQFKVKKTALKLKFYEFTKKKNFLVYNQQWYKHFSLIVSGCENDNVCTVFPYKPFTWWNMIWMLEGE